MKTFILILLSLTLNKISGAAEREDCVDWEKQLDAIVADFSDINAWKLKPGKTSKDLVEVAKSYPAPRAIDMNVKAGESNADAMKRILNEPGCRTLRFLDVAKSLLKGSNSNASVKKEFIRSYVERLRKDDVIHTTLIESFVASYILQLYTEEKVLELSDAAFFELGSIRDDQARVRNELQTSTAWTFTSAACANDPRKCLNRDLGTQLKKLRFEGTETSRLARRLNWLAKRIEF